jgi:hypothetical protein
MVRCAEEERLCAHHSSVPTDNRVFLSVLIFSVFVFFCLLAMILSDFVRLFLCKRAVFCACIYLLNRHTHTHTHLHNPVTSRTCIQEALVTQPPLLIPVFDHDFPGVECRCYWYIALLCFLEKSPFVFNCVAFVLCDEAMKA